MVGGGSTVLVFLSRGTAAPMPPLPGSLVLLQRLAQPLRLLLCYLPLCGPLTERQDAGWASAGWFQTPQQRPLLGPRGEPPTEPGVWGNRTDRPQHAACHCISRHPLLHLAPLLGVAFWVIFPKGQLVLAGGRWGKGERFLSCKAL